MPEPIDLDALGKHMRYCIDHDVSIANEAAPDVLQLIAELRALRLERDRLRAALQSELEWLQKWQCMTRHDELKAALDGEKPGEG